MASPKGNGKRSSQNYIDDEDEPGEKQAALNDRIVQFFEVIFQTNNRQKIEKLRTVAVCRNYRHET